MSNTRGYFVYECLDCGYKGIDYRDGISCSECGGRIVPIGEATKEAIMEFKIATARNRRKQSKKNNLKLAIDIEMNMQEYYDNLVLYRDCLNAQIEVLAKSPSICTHKETIEIQDGIKICANKHCNKVIDSGIHDWCV